MTLPRRSRGAIALVLAVASSLTGVAGPVAPASTLTATAEATTLPAWTGSIDLYRRGVFTTQASWLYCTAADVQIARNIVHGEQDHRAASQAAYFGWMRTENRYSIPVSDGVDVRGWTRGLGRWVDPRYAAVASTSFSNALRSAVRRLRQTNLPVALLVMHGDHGWLLTGFSATADPALGPGYVVTAVRVVGPLYGLQSRGGYDMPPDTLLSPATLARFLTPFHYGRTPMVWEGRWMTIQPIPG